MILINDDRKQLISLKFIRNMLNLTMNEFAAHCGVDISLISKMESGETQYGFKYKKKLLSLANIDIVDGDKDIYRIKINDCLKTLLYRDSSATANKLERNYSDQLFSSMYFLDYYLLCKITEVGTRSDPFISKLENDKFETIILKLGDCPKDTTMLIDIYFMYKFMLYGEGTSISDTTQKYRNIDMYSHFILYLLFLSNVMDFKYNVSDTTPIKLAMHYKNIFPNARSKQIIALARSCIWLTYPSSSNYKKFIKSQKYYIEICNDSLKPVNFNAIISCNFAQSEYYELIENAEKYSHFLENQQNYSIAHVYFMCTIAAYKINNDRLYKKYFNILKTKYSGSDSKYLIEIAEKYPKGRSIKRPVERQINRIFNIWRSQNILLLLLEYYKIYDVTEFEVVRNFLSKYPDFKLF